MRALAKYAQAQYQFDQSRVVAPFDAWVLEVRTQVGQNVVNALEARPLVVLAAAGEYLVQLRVPAATLDRLKIGQAANVTVGGKSYAGRVHALTLEPAGGKADGPHDVTVLFQSPEMLRPGRSATVELP